jgi:hypothetical protein
MGEEMLKRYTGYALGISLVLMSVLNVEGLTHKEKIDQAVQAVIDSISGGDLDAVVWTETNGTRTTSLRDHLNNKHQAADSVHPKLTVDANEQRLGHQFFKNPEDDTLPEGCTDANVAQNIVEIQVRQMRNNGYLAGLDDIEYIPHNGNAQNQPTLKFNAGVYAGYRNVSNQNRRSLNGLNQFLGESSQCKVTVNLQQHEIYRPYVMFPQENGSALLDNAQVPQQKAANGRTWAKIPQDGLVFGLKKNQQGGWVVCTIYPTTWSQVNQWHQAHYDTHINQIVVERWSSL